MFHVLNIFLKYMFMIEVLKQLAPSTKYPRKLRKQFFWKIKVPRFQRNAFPKLRKPITHWLNIYEYARLKVFKDKFSIKKSSTMDFSCKIAFGRRQMLLYTWSYDAIHSFEQTLENIHATSSLFLRLKMKTTLQTSS